jgi:S1-C subfamily serine protease
VGVSSFWYTGIIYNYDIPGLVAGLVPNSPADKAGIKTGDKILETLTASGKSNEMFKKPIEKINKWGLLYTYPKIDNSKGIIFTIQRADKSKAKITVYPEKIVYEWLAKK